MKSICITYLLCSRFLEQSASNTEEKLDKHRFLVQSKVIEDSEFSRIATLSAQLRSEEVRNINTHIFFFVYDTFFAQFTKIWEGPKDDRKNIKLKVEFRYPEVRAPAPVRGPSAAPSDSAEGVRTRLSRSENQSARVDDTVAPSGSPDLVLSELQNLRKKYDAVVEYTVHLTAERDAIVAQLETSQRELVKEKGRKKTAAEGGADKSEVLPERSRKPDKVSHRFAGLFMSTR